ncbi:hypothetical protein EYF80_063861 [Liparis tanakae]|uniref:Uncharacterized protein n=1 Tax=Liparis tanakae TaxID=230148 RepID=A0A4Z2EBA5_9TELE|nr:hypothetical protein EYF80_063861 [Liparis tanakae]
MRSCRRVKASLEYWKLNVENGDSGSSKMSKSANSFSDSVVLGTPGSKATTSIYRIWSTGMKR